MPIKYIEHVNFTIPPQTKVCKVYNASNTTVGLAVISAVFHPFNRELKYDPLVKESNGIFIV